MRTSPITWSDASEEAKPLIELCEAKLDEYKAKRGKRIW
jgi:hypothetical protein